VLSAKNQYDYYADSMEEKGMEKKEEKKRK
jgi:hypothetical protein